MLVCILVKEVNVSQNKIELKFQPIWFRKYEWIAECTSTTIYEFADVIPSFQGILLEMFEEKIRRSRTTKILLQIVKLSPDVRNFFRSKNDIDKAIIYSFWESTGWQVLFAVLEAIL